MVPKRARKSGSQTLVSLSSRLKDLLGLVTKSREEEEEDSLPHVKWLILKSTEPLLNQLILGKNLGGEALHHDARHHLGDHEGAVPARPQDLHVLPPPSRPVSNHLVLSAIRRVCVVRTHANVLCTHASVLCTHDIISVITKGRCRHALEFLLESSPPNILA